MSSNLARGIKLIENRKVIMKYKSEDKFQEFITKIVSLYYHQKVKFFAIAGGIVAAIVIVIIALTSSGKENPEVQLRFTEALGVYSMGNYEQAQELFTNFTRRFGGHYLSAKAHFYLANIHYQNQEYDQARREFERAYGKLKKNPILGPASLLGIGNCYEETQNFKKAAEIYEQVYKRYPKSDLGAEALLAAGRCYINLNNLEQAKRIYQKAVKELPPGETAEQAKFQLAYINGLQNKF